MSERRTASVEAINLRRGIALVDGSVLPIVVWLDADNRSCEEPEAVACVAGRDGFGFIRIALSDFDPVTLQ